jgi:hypothetical protein
MVKKIWRELNMNKDVLKIASLCVLILFSCEIKKTDTVTTQDILMETVAETLDTALSANGASDIVKQTKTVWIELKYDGGINPYDLTRMGITGLRSIEQLLAVLPDEQVKKIGVINLERENINSFKGIERFTDLTSFGIRRSSIKNLKDLKLQKETWFFLDESEIGSLKGLDNSDNIKNLVSLTLDGVHIKDKKSLELIGKLNSLRNIGLERFSDYKKVLGILPESIELITISDNGINSIKEIEFLKEKYPHLRYVYVGQNNFTEEDVRAERPNWWPIELCWWEF